MVWIWKRCGYLAKRRRGGNIFDFSLTSFTFSTLFFQLKIGMDGVYWCINDLIFLCTCVFIQAFHISNFTSYGVGVLWYLGFVRLRAKSAKENWEFFFFGKVGGEGLGGGCM